MSSPPGSGSDGVIIHNPVVRGVNPDPSACRVGDDFFLATSTLEFWPGIPIRHSTDLVTWEIIGHAVTRPAQYRRDGLPGPLKLYAPTLRHHDGTFYLACTNVAPGQGNFILTTADPAGEWSDAVWVDAEAFDPSLTIEEGTAYYTRRTVVSGKEGSGPVIQAEIDLATGALVTEATAITPGGAGYCSNDIEGPHLYRIADWWYLVSAEGGTWKGHMATVARSRSPLGPFEGFEGNPVLTHRHRVGHPIQSTGHAELLDDAAGNWWALFLGTRHIGATSWHHLGRETFLAPVTWNEGWPTIGSAGTVELEHLSLQPLPGTGRPWIHEPTPWTRGWSTRERPLDGVTVDGTPREGSTINLPHSDRVLSDEGAVSALFVRQEEFRSTFTATLDASPPMPGRAGITVYASPLHHYELLVTALGHETTVALRRTVGDMVVESSVEVDFGLPVHLRVVATESTYEFAVSTDARTPDRVAADAWRSVGSGAVRLLSAETSQTYSGIRFGVVAHGRSACFGDVRISQ